MMDVVKLVRCSKGACYTADVCFISKRIMNLSSHAVADDVTTSGRVFFDSICQCSTLNQLTKKDHIRLNIYTCL